MATFGNTTEETSISSGWNDFKYVDSFALSEAGDVSKLTLYCLNTGGGHAACNIKAVIYSNSGSAPNALLGTGSAVGIADNAAVAWVDLPFSADVSLSAGTYWLGFIGDADADGLIARVHSSGGHSGYNADTYSDGPSDPAGALTDDGGNYIAIYGTYTATGGSTVPVHLLRTHLHPIDRSF